MTDLQEKAMKMALEFVVLASSKDRAWFTEKEFEVVAALRQALAQPEPYDQTALELCDVCGWKAIIPDEGCLVCARKNQEPVMWSIFDGKSHDVFDTKYDADNMTRFKNGKVVVKPLYTAPPKREWVGLTDEDLKPLCDEWRIMYGGYVDDFAKSIEAKLKEKNI